MPVDTTHEQVSYAAGAWTLVRDCVSGQRAVKKKRYAYLPGLAEQSTEDYERYLYRARFFNVTGRTLEAFVGFIFNKDPQFAFQPQLDAFMLDATLTGKSYYNYCKDTVSDATAIGRRGTLIDWDTDEARAYVTHYEAEDIINWDTIRYKGHTILSLLVLHECAPKRDLLLDDIFLHPTESHWRVFQLVFDSAGNPYVQCTILRKMETASADKPPAQPESEARRKITALIPGSEGFELLDQFSPTRRSIPLNRIPFEFHNATDNEPNISKVPLEDLAKTNISHNHTTADLERGRHIAGNPTLYAAGFNVKGKDKLHVGSPVAWISDNVNAKAGYIEFTGQGLQPLEKAIEEKKQDMANQGARMLESQTSSAGVEAFETVQMRQSGEASVLLKIALACSESLSHVMQWVFWWHGAGEKPEDLEKDANARLNTEFLQLNIDPAMLGQLWSGYLSGALSYDELFYKLKRGRIIRDDTSIEDERKALARSPVNLAEDVTDPKAGAGSSRGAA